MVEAMISLAEFEREIALRDAKIERLQRQLDAVLRLLKKGKSERFVPSVDAAQGNLFDLPEQADIAQQTQTVRYERKVRAKPKKNHPGRAPLPDHLERREEVLEPELDPAYEWERIGEERTEVLEHEPGELYVRVIVRPTYKKKAPCETSNEETFNEETSNEETQIVTAPLPERALPGSYAGEGLLAHLIVNKLVDHLPFDRQRRAMKRDYDLDIPKSTINSWFAAVCTLLEPLYELLKARVLAQDYLQADESRIEVLTTIAKDKHGKVKKNKRKLKPQTSKIRRGWMWVVHDPVHAYVVFNFEPGRGKADADALLGNYSGYLQVDGYSSYEDLLAEPGVIYVACTAHVRRKFFDALKNDRVRAEQALTLLAEMYRHEREVRPYTAAQRHAYRLIHLAPLLSAFKTWLDEQCIRVTPKSTIGQAMSYAQNRYRGMKNVLLDGRLELDNNLIENQIRPLALGRKNYLFAGSDAAAQRLAMLYSLFGTCKALGVNPHRWLKRVLQLIPETKMSELGKLLPGKLKLD